jgi:DNA-binding MarR family transcriptional regulator
VKNDNINVKMTGPLRDRRKAMNVPQPSRDGRQSILELNRLITATRVFSHDLEMVSEAILDKHDLSPQERRLLMALRKNRSITVPQLARKCQVSRQYVQVTMNALARRGWVAFHQNPEHKRSRLLELTPDAEDRIREILTREGEALQRVAAGLSPEEVRQAVAVLDQATDSLSTLTP